MGTQLSIKYVIIFRSKRKQISKHLNCQINGLKISINAMRHNNRNDLLHLSFALKISLFSEAFLEPS